MRRESDRRPDCSDDGASFHRRTSFPKKVLPVPKAFLIGKTLAKHANSAQNGVSFKLPLATIAILLREFPYWGIHKWSETANMGGQRRLQ
ncbi:hypothetical protein RB4026 [Rhodopirellula baltica SH 1]|uniref:Uncharacterized protein n=1 Tax=Rhodopirellula baltica (strain DSM 10527 / NCIMB 13988 / SH1) TaxID=243090 RepID=Q7UT86_RHOBA|nr:hypothetical protein RB4026 [Rhodopirellula baltica SH 1]